MRHLAILTALALSALPSASAIAQVAFGNQGETYEKDRAWEYELKNGACTRLRDRRTDSPADIAECKRQYAQQPLCLSYQSWATIWFDLRDDPIPGVNTLADQTDVINTLGEKGKDEPLAYELSPQYRDMLRRLLNVALSPNRNSRWSTRDQFADYAYKICMEGHPF